jgi:hypothetical protein
MKELHDERLDIHVLSVCSVVCNVQMIEVIRKNRIVRPVRRIGPIMKTIHHLLRPHNMLQERAMLAFSRLGSQAQARAARARRPAACFHSGRDRKNILM